MYRRYLYWIVFSCIGLMSLLGSWPSAQAVAVDPAYQFRPTLIREAQAVYGIRAPIPMFAGQIKQESGWRPNVTAWDNGRGLAQFMDATTEQIVRTFPELGPADPYNPKWAIRALVRYDLWISKRVKADTECDKWAASLKGYNAGLGYVQRAQKRSSEPGLWFGHTELINAGQSEKNYEYSRLYPHWILEKHQTKYLDWGEPTCLATSK